MSERPAISYVEVGWRIVIDALTKECAAAPYEKVVYHDGLKEISFKEDVYVGCTNKT